MRVAIIGAGIVGVTTAYELALDGHEVTVFERRGSVAAETSFANAGLVAPGYVGPWAAPGMPTKVLRQLFGRHSAVRIAGLPDGAMRRWLWRWLQACGTQAYAHNRERMHVLARYSAERLDDLTQRLDLAYEQGQGLLVLLRKPRDVAAAERTHSLLTDWGVQARLCDADACRAIEPGLSAATALAGGLYLPNERVGNCRQFANLLRAQAQRLGAQFRFDTTVHSLQPGAPVRMLSHCAETAANDEFDAVVVCAAMGSASLLAGLGVQIPLAAVYGYSITAPLRHSDSEHESAPRASLMDETFKVAISRLGQRVRLAGGAEIGGTLERHDPRALATLYKVLDDWFPGAAHNAQAQAWKGARPMLPDGPPLLGALGVPGMWLNLGHGSSGWALSCGSARVVADLVANRPPAIDASGFGSARWRAR